jgi:hypothetical protein
MRRQARRPTVQFIAEAAQETVKTEAFLSKVVNCDLGVIGCGPVLQPPDPELFKDCADLRGHVVVSPLVPEACTLQFPSF